jgi:hypothetical protein
MLTVRKLLLCASLAGALVLGGAVWAQPQAERAPSRQPPTGKQTQSATKLVTGKIASIGTGGHSFTLEVSDNSGNARTMNFVVDNNTQVQGQVKQGTPVTVEYTVMDGGQNLAVSVTAQA